MPLIDIDIYAWNGASPSTTCFDGTSVQFSHAGHVDKSLTTSCNTDPHGTTQLTTGVTYTCVATNGTKSNPNGQTFTPSNNNTVVNFYLT
jgi:hypothetical protein